MTCFVFFCFFLFLFFFFFATFIFTGNSISFDISGHYIQRIDEIYTNPHQAPAPVHDRLRSAG